MEPIKPLMVREMNPATVREDINVMQQLVDAALTTRSPEVTSLFVNQVCRRELSVAMTMKFVSVLLQARFLPKEIVPKIALYQALRTGETASAKETLQLFSTPKQKETFIQYVMEQSVQFDLEYALIVNLKNVNFFCHFLPPKAFLERALDLAMSKNDFELISCLIKLPDHPPENIALILSFLMLYRTRHDSFPDLMKWLALPPLPQVELLAADVSTQLEPTVERFMPLTFKEILSIDIKEIPLIPNWGKTTDELLAAAFEAKDYHHIWDYVIEGVTNVDIVDSAGMSLIHWAVKKCYVRLSFKIIRQGASLGHLLFPHYHPDFVNFISHLTTLPNIQRNLPELLLEPSRVECVSFFSEFGLRNRPLNPHSETLLNEAIKNGFVRLARHLAMTNKIVNVPNQVKEPTTEILKLDPTNPEVIDLCRILKQRCDFANQGYDGTTLLHLSIFNNKMQWVQFLANKVNVHSRDYLQRTPLHVAIMHKNEAAVILLTRLGADWFAEDFQGYCANFYLFKCQNYPSLEFRLREFPSIKPYLHDLMYHREGQDRLSEMLANLPSHPGINPLKPPLVLNNPYIFQQVAKKLSPKQYLHHLQNVKASVPALSWIKLMSFALSVDKNHFRPNWLMLDDASQHLHVYLRKFREEILYKVTEGKPEIYNAILLLAQEFFGLEGLQPLPIQSSDQFQLNDEQWLNYCDILRQSYNPEKIIRTILGLRRIQLTDDNELIVLNQIVEMLFHNQILIETTHVGTFQSLIIATGKAHIIIEPTDENTYVDILGESEDSLDSIDSDADDSWDDSVKK